MQQQKGAMSAALMGLIAVCTVLILVVIVVVSSYFSAASFGNASESQLRAVKTNSKNIFAQYGQKVLEVAQVPDMYKKDLLESTEAAISGRYGENGSQATFQMIKEQNPNLDASMYKQIQQVIEAGRNDFTNAQTQLIDIRRQYEKALGSPWQGFWLRMAGYPRSNLDDFDIVSTDRADTAFRNKKEDGPIILRR